MRGWIIALALCLVVFFYWATQESAAAKSLMDANEAYLKGVEAETLYDRDRFLNEALTGYSGLEEGSSLHFSNGHFYQTMGTLLHELQADSFALLYLYRAENLSPRDQGIKDQIAEVREVLGLPQEARIDAFDTLFFFHRLISLPRRLQLLFFGGLAAIFLWSGVLWLKKGKGAALAVTAICALLFVSILYQRYFEPLEGVLIQATLLTREAENSDDWVTKRPTPSGMKVKVLGVSEEGKWLKVLVPDGTLGFVSADRIRII